MTTPSDADVKLWNMLSHLSALAGVVIPFGNLLGPFIVWQVKKNEIPSVDQHAKDALNFQLTATLAVLALSIIAFILSFFCIGYLLFPVIALLGFAAIGYSVYAGIQVNNGAEFKYFYNLNLIK